LSQCCEIVNALRSDLASDDLEFAEVRNRWHGQGVVREKGLLAAATIA
jgi:hypothetical protein